jgi:hypothetical protein
MKRKAQHRRPTIKQRAEFCLRQTLLDLRQSIAAGRPISLPNAVRLCKRRLAAAGFSKTDSIVQRLTGLYRRKQPFRSQKTRTIGR